MLHKHKVVMKCCKTKQNLLIFMLSYNIGY